MTTSDVASPTRQAYRPRAPEVLDLIRALVDATLAAQCMPDTDFEDEQLCVHYAVEVMRAIRAAPELADLHPWADARLAAADAGWPDEWVETSERVKRRDDNSVQRAV